MVSLWRRKFDYLSVEQASLQKRLDTLAAKQVALTAKIDYQGLVIAKMQKDIEAIADNTQVIIDLLQGAK